MKAYVIGRMNIRSKEWMDKYYATVPSLIESHCGRLIVRGGNPEQLEGSEALPDAAVLLEFPSRDHAMSFWNSEEFQPFVQLRQSGSSLQAMVVDALE
ncbi:MAG: hypothetical protein COA52_11265 [Hyphomicrobiales bacterium]|nr:DUF1330 domain-containing protein [Hyphomicrobiales bacterium]PCJ89938.1 MAG: hypothetical protein COA52_11265 [Hyphomicrobiales bacterium]